jgi:hypothetical protein
MGLKTSPCFTPHVETKSLLVPVLNLILQWKFLNLNKIIHENQIGFKEESRNTDHIFTLKSIIEIYESQKKKVLAADFPFLSVLTALRMYQTTL